MYGFIVFIYTFVAITLFFFVISRGYRRKRRQEQRKLSEESRKSSMEEILVADNKVEEKDQPCQEPTEENIKELIAPKKSESQKKIDWWRLQCLQFIIKHFVMD